MVLYASTPNCRLYDSDCISGIKHSIVASTQSFDSIQSDDFYLHVYNIRFLYRHVYGVAMRQAAEHSKPDLFQKN